MLGLSLPPSYLAGTPISEEAALVERTCGEAAGLLEHLKTKGLASVELRKVYEDTPPGLVLAAARRVWAAGLSRHHPRHHARSAGGPHLRKPLPSP